VLDQPSIGACTVAAEDIDDVEGTGKKRLMLHTFHTAVSSSA